MKDHDMSRRNFLKLLGLSAAVAATGVPLIGCDEKEDSQPIPERTTALLENYPYFLQNPADGYNLDFTLVVGEDAGEALASADISLGIQRILEQKLENALDSKVNSLDQNLILVGRTSQYTYPEGYNRLLDDLTNIDPNAVPALGFDEGLIKIHNYGNFTHLIVTGYGPDQVRNCCTVLNQPEVYQTAENSEFFGKNLLVKGTLNNFVLGKPKDE